MINLDQVRTLEWKVKQAVQLIVHLRRENDTLRGRLSDTEVRLQDLESLLESFKATQNEMESGIRNALEDLDNLEAGAEAPAPGPVDALSYPPVTVSEPVEEPVVRSEPAVAPAVAESVEPSFEEEYAALAAAEAEALAGDSFDASITEEAVVAPDSIELEETPPQAGQDDETLFFEAPVVAEPEPVVPEEKQPEQPGLGIF